MLIVIKKFVVLFITSLEQNINAPKFIRRLLTIKTGHVNHDGSDVDKF